MALGTTRSSRSRVSADSPRGSSAHSGWTHLGLTAIGAALLAVSASGKTALTAPVHDHHLVVIKAGTAHLVEDGVVLEGGASVLVNDGQIERVGGADMLVPPGAHVVDYGPDAVIVPGFVSADSGYASGVASQRTADPTLLALDGFDFYAHNLASLSGGITTAYINPASGRLIAGSGAVVKLAGHDRASRILSAQSSLHGAISSEARRTPGYWVPPVPATVDVGMGYAKPQLPRTLMGAFVALDELLGAAQGDSADARAAADAEYGPGISAALRKHLDARTPWRMNAETSGEIRSLLAFAAEKKLNLIVEGGRDAKDVAADLAASGTPVIFRVPFTPNSGARNWGKSPDAVWPEFDVPAALATAGVKFALARNGSTRDLLFAAQLSLRGGLSPAEALRSITLSSAEILGVDKRVGSLSAGKDADLVVMNGAPMQAGSSVLATWVGGERMWSAQESNSVVLEVEELHIGDGQVLRPGQLLMEGGVIREVGQSVSHPLGSLVIKGRAAMPGMIDAMGHLGLDGSMRAPDTDFDMSSIIAPGDEVDRRVAQAGITTVLLTPRGGNASGLQMTAYKPAAAEFKGQIVSDPATLMVNWTRPNRYDSGKMVQALLAKAADYREKWAEYEEELAQWQATPPEPDESASKKDDEEEDEDEDDEEAEEDEDDSKKKKKRKKKGEEEEPEADPVTGIWEGSLDAASIRFQMRLDGAEVEAYLRSSELSERLIELKGSFADKEIDLHGFGTKGAVRLQGKPSHGEFKGSVSLTGGEAQEFEAKRTSDQFPTADRPVRRLEDVSGPPRGMPRTPKLDKGLEPFRKAMDGSGTIVCEVDREDEILACVEAFNAYGIKPILYGAAGLDLVLDKVQSGIAGVLPVQQVLYSKADEGLRYYNRYADLQAAGVPVAFRSAAEEGAIELPNMAAFAVSKGMSPEGALRALTSDVADMFHISDRVGRLGAGLDADVLLIDGPPLAPATSVLRTWVRGREVIR